MTKRQSRKTMKGRGKEKYEKKTGEDGEGRERKLKECEI
jgi:hypothetical protein